MSLKKARAVLLGGMGYPATELPTGLPTLKTKLEALGAEVFMDNWRRRTEAYNFAHAWAGPLFFFGDSLGAGSAGQYPGDLKRTTDFACGFQPSQYDDRTKKDPQTGEYYQLVSPRIVHAVDFYNDIWVQTLGLGYARWRKIAGSQTQLIGIQHHAPHPDDWNYAQTVALAHLESIWRTL